MKRKITAFICIAACLSLMLAACGSSGTQSTEAQSQDSTTAAESQTSETKAEAQNGESSDILTQFADYIGNTFVAEDPWGENASIEVKYENDHLELVYSDNLTEDIEFTSTIYLLDGDPKVSFEMQDSEDTWEASYSGDLELKDGQIIITFGDGALTTKSAEGDSNSHQIGALDDESKTIVFEKQ